MKVIGHIRTDFPSKFGIPRQSGLIDGLKGKIVLEPEYRNPQVYKGIEEFSTSGFSGSSQRRRRNTGQPQSSLRDLAAKNVWAFSPPELRSVPTTSAFPV